MSGPDQKTSSNDLLRRIFSKSEKDLRIEAIRELARRKDTRGLAAFTKILTDQSKTEEGQDLDLAMAAADAIKDLEDPRGFDLLILIMKDSSAPIPLRSLIASVLFSLDLKRAVEACLDSLHNLTSEEHQLIILAILDKLQYYMPKMPQKYAERIRSELESVLDDPYIRDSWNIATSLAKTLTLYNSLMGLKFLLFYKNRLSSLSPEHGKYFLDSVQVALDDLKSYNSLSRNSTDAALYELIAARDSSISKRNQQ